MSKPAMANPSVARKVERGCFIGQLQGYGLEVELIGIMRFQENGTWLAKAAAHIKEHCAVGVGTVCFGTPQCEVAGSTHFWVVGTCVQVEAEESERGGVAEHFAEGIVRGGEEALAKRPHSGLDHHLHA